MSNCFYVDVSCSQADVTTIFEDFDTDPNCLSYSYETVVNARNNVDDFNVFNRGSKTNYDSKVIRSIHVQGQFFTGSEYANFARVYVILYKTILGEDDEIIISHPAEFGGSLNEWFLYCDPETVLNYKMYKIGNYNVQQPFRSVKIDISYNKPILFRPNDIIVVEYAILFWNFDYAGDVHFWVDATADVRFDSV